MNKTAKCFYLICYAFFKIADELLSDMRIVPLGSVGVILDVDCLLNWFDIKLVIQAPEIEEKMIC
jgi:hypothetical protein